MSTNITRKVTSVVLSATTALWLSGFTMLVPVAHAQATDLQAQINALLQQIAALQAQLAAQTGGAAAAPSCNFTRDLTVGSKGDDVKCLQQYLNGAGQKVAASGAGSPGNETTYFGSLSRAAVAKWQAANNLSPAVGYFGPKSRAKYTSLAAAPGAPAPAAPGAPAGTGLTVTLAPNQPANGLFGESFASRDFTKLNFTASADGDVTVNSLKVERTGQANDSAFSGVILLDEDGTRLGATKTFGSDHTLTLTEKFTVKAGKTRTMSLAGDSDSDQNDYNGQLVSLSLTKVDAGSANVNASYPLVGATHTVNSTLAIGTLTVAIGAFDPGAGLTKEVGTAGSIFSGLRLIAGSDEDILLKSVRWYQNGSAGAADLANVKVNLDGTDYVATVSSDGKYYTGKFGDGVTVLKGLNKQVYVRGDVVGGSGRTVDLDVFRFADIQAVGKTYNYSVLPSRDGGAAAHTATDDNGSIGTEEPNFDAYEAYIGSGTITAQNATSVGSQNIAISLGDQPLGGLIVDVKGEDITVAGMNFDLSVVDDGTDSATGASIDTNDITGITLADASGTVVAGPVDGSAGGNNGIRFTNTVTFKPGRTVYTLKGKIGTDIGNNDTVAASTTPSSDWTTVKGVTSTTTVTPSPSSAVTMSTMTVKAAVLTLTLTPNTQANGSTTAQNVVAGTGNYKFTDYVLDASGSGEDVRVTGMQLRLTFTSANAADDLTNCQLYDGSTPLNTGGNLENPTNSLTSAANRTFAFDTGLIVPKGTVKTLSVKCNLVAGAALGHQWEWGITDADASLTATGMTSGQTVDGSDSITANDGRIITAVSGGSLSANEDPVTPLKWVQAGSTDNTLLSLRLNATDEDVIVNTLGLQIATSTDSNAPSNASNSPSDVAKVTIWNNATNPPTKVGEAVFTSTDYATATLTGVTVPKDGQVILTVKADAGLIGTSLAGRPGHMLFINYDASNSTNCDNATCQRGVVGVGGSSGTTIGSAGSDTGTNGARLARAYPTVTKLSLPNNTFGQNATSKALYRFKVSAPSGTNGVSLYKFTFNLSTSSKDVVELPTDDGDAGSNIDTDFSNDFTVANLQVKCYSDEFVTPSCGNTNGLMNQYALAIANGVEDNVDFGSTSVHMPAFMVEASTEALAGGIADGDGTVLQGDQDVDLSVYFNPTATASGTPEAIRITAGTTRWFELLGDITNATTTHSITVKMQGDASFAVGGHVTGRVADENGGKENTADSDDWSTGRYIFATTAGLTDLYSDNDFIWSGNSTNSSQNVVDYDWFNGFLVPGLSNTDTGVAETLSKSS